MNHRIGKKNDVPMNSSRDPSTLRGWRSSARASTDTRVFTALICHGLSGLNHCRGVQRVSLYTGTRLTSHMTSDSLIHASSALMCVYPSMADCSCPLCWKRICPAW